MKTIKQIADDLGVSKQAVRNEIAKQKLQSTLQKNGNQFLADEKAEKLIKSAFSERKSVKEKGQVAGNTDANLTEKLFAAQRRIIELETTLKLKDANEKEKIEIYNQEIKRLDEALKEKSEQIAQLHKLIDQEQQLRMVTEQKLLLLEEKKEDEGLHPEEEKKGFFRRIFGS